MRANSAIDVKRLLHLLGPDRSFDLTGLSILDLRQSPRFKPRAPIYMREPHSWPRAFRTTGQQSCLPV